jgi:hypothetical protein
MILHTHRNTKTNTSRPVDPHRDSPPQHPHAPNAKHALFSYYPHTNSNSNSNPNEPPTPTPQPHESIPSPNPNAPTLTPTNAPDDPDAALTLNLDRHGKPLTYATAKSGPDRLHWIIAKAEEITRLILSGTIIPIAYSAIPGDRLGDIV